MGSKMSFGRGSSDQNIVSELTSVAPHPRSSIDAASDCNQTFEDKRSSEIDLDSGWGDEMKVTEMNQPALESHSSMRLEAESHVSCETVGGPTCQQSEQHISSQVEMEAKSEMTSASMCSSTTDSRGKPVEVHRRRGRPRKIKLLLTGDKRDPDAVGLDAVQHKEVSTTIPLPTSSEFHSSDDLPKAVDTNLVSNEMSSPHAVSDDGVEGGVPLMPRRRRGRPKKEEMTTHSKAAAPASTPTDPPHANNVCGPARRLRSRGEQPSTQDETTESHSKGDLKQNELSPIESSMSNFQVVKRRRRRLQVDQQVPAKVSKLDNSQEAISLLSNNTIGVGTAETDKQVELNAEKVKAVANGKGKQLSLQAGEGQEQQLIEGVIPQQKLFSKPKPEVIPSECLNSLNLESHTLINNPEIKQSVDLNEKSQTKTPDPEIKQSVDLNEKSQTKTPDPEIKQSVDMNKKSQSKSPDSSDFPVDVEVQKAELSSADLLLSAKETPKAAELPLALKPDNEETKLYHLNPASQLNDPKVFQYSANTTVTLESSNSQRNTFRRKRGGKRRRRISNVLLLKEQPVESQEGSSDVEQKTDCGDMDRESESNVIYIKKGGKTLLKCGYCSRTFKFLSQFVIHQRIHTGERPFKCPECGKGFSKNSNLNLHLKTHRKSSIHVYEKCPFCNLKFSCSEYAAHMKMHAQELDKDCKNNNKPDKRSRGGDCEKSQELQKEFPSERRERKVCQYCGKSFQFQSALIRHVRVHTGEKPYKCDICGKAFGQAYFLRVHELTHWSVKRYNCTRCEKSFTHYSNAKNHTCRPVGSSVDLHSNRRVKPSLTYTCHICKNIFDNLQEFNSHMRDHTGAKLYRCLYCDKLFGVLSEFNDHRSQCRVERNTPGIKEEETMSLIQYTVPALRCATGHSLAPVIAADCETQKRQSQTHHKKRSANTQRPFQSTVIPAHSLSLLASKLNKLDNRSDPRKYLCPGCGRLFRHMGRLRAHMLTHAPTQSYTCDCCGKRLRNWKKLWHHQRIHRQRRGRFICPQCGKGFRFVETYKKHMSEHPEFQWVEVRPKKVTLPYQCEQCRCSFKTLDLLFNHQLCHSSTQDTRRDSNLDLLIDDHNTQSNKKILNPPTNSNIAKLRPAPEVNNSAFSALARSPGSTILVPSVAPMVSFVTSRSLDLSGSSEHPSRPHSTHNREASCDRTDVNAPITPLRTVKRHVTQNASKSSEGPPDCVQCAVCGNGYSAISDLYQHYLQHARGEV